MGTTWVFVDSVRLEPVDEFVARSDCLEDFKLTIVKCYVTCQLSLLCFYTTFKADNIYM